MRVRIRLRVLSVSSVFMISVRETITVRDVKIRMNVKDMLMVSIRSRVNMRNKVR